MTKDGVTWSIELGRMPLEVVALLFGQDLVDLSIEWEDHLVRGTQ